MSCWRFLRRAAFTAAMGEVLYAATAGEEPSDPSPLPLAAPAGHLALVRAHPGLRDLNALLTPRPFLVDATQALLSCALRRPPDTRATLLDNRRVFSDEILSAESEGDEDLAAWARLRLALVDARDGSLDDALDVCVRLAAEGPGDTAPRVTAAALCHVLGRPDEAALWLGASPDDLSAPDKAHFLGVLVTARLGSPPRTVAGADAEKLVAFAALGLVEVGMWCMFKDANLPDRLQLLASMVFLRRVVANFYKDHALEDAVPS